MKRMYPQGNILENSQYDSLDSTLHEYYNNYIKLKEDKTKFIVENLNQEVEKTIMRLKAANPLFDKYYCRLEYTGSYWDRVKVKLADEFDINLVLRLPADCFVERTKDILPGYIYIKVNKKPRCRFSVNRGPVNMYKMRFRNIRREYNEKPKKRRTRATEHEFSRFTSKRKKFVRPDYVLSWMQSVFAKAEITTRQNISRSGPALTATMPFDRRVTVDFTPVFEIYEMNITSHQINTFFAVPKPQNGNINTWRISICQYEKRMLKTENSKYLKFTFKLLKKVRDNYDMFDLASYYIKTLFLHEVIDKTDVDWSQHIGRLFLYMLDRLRIALKRKCIPSIVDKKLNLLRTLNKQKRVHSMYLTIVDIEKRLENASRERNEKNIKTVVEKILGRI